MNPIVERICKFAEEEIDGAGCRSVDFKARIMIRLLQALGEDEAAERVYEYYETHA